MNDKNAQRLKGGICSSSSLKGSMNANGALKGATNSGGELKGAVGIGTVLRGDRGEPGATFIPNVDEDGNLYWTNNEGLDNPNSVNIRGPQGPTGEDGISPIVSVETIDDGYRLTVTDKNGPKTFDVLNGKDSVGIDHGLFLVDLDLENLVCSHTPLEIVSAAEEGKVIYFDLGDGERTHMPMNYTDGDLILWMISSGGSETEVSVAEISIFSDKSIDFQTAFVQGVTEEERDYWNSKGGVEMVSLNFITGTASHNPTEILNACEKGKSISFDLGNGETIRQVPINFYKSSATGSFSSISDNVTIVTNVTIYSNKSIAVQTMELNPMSERQVIRILEAGLVSDGAVAYFNDLIDARLAALKS